MSKRLIVVGLDGVSWRVLNKLIDKGVTPNLEKIKNNSAKGTCISTIPPLTPTAWSSIQTGVNPGKHGVYTFIAPRKSSPKDRSPKPVNAEDIKIPTLPEYLENSGHKGVLINLPLSHPPKTDFPTIGSMFSTEKVFPKELEKKYDFEKYSIPMIKSPTNIVSNLKDIYDNLQEHFEVVKEIFKNEEWDFFFYLFTHTDWAQHQAGTDFFLDKDNKENKWFQRIYKKVDDKVGWFINQLDEDTNIIFLSDHGFDYHHEQLSPAKKMYEEGLIDIRTKKLGYEKQFSFKDNLIKNTFRVLMKSNKLSKILETKYPWFCSKNRYQNEDNSKFLWSPVCNTTFYLNDERFYGIMDEPDKEKEILKKILNSLSDKINVYEKEDIYWGDRLNDAPELITLADKALPRMLLLLEKDEITEKAFEHSIDGIIMGYGPDIKTGGLKKSSLYDLTPTVLHYFDIPLSRNFDGKALLNMFSEESQFNREVEYIDKKESEEEKIKKRIGSLEL